MEKALTHSHDKKKTCGICKHPSMGQTRAHVRENGFPEQKSTGK